MSTLAIFLCVLRGGLLWPRGRHLWPPVPPNVHPQCAAVHPQHLLKELQGQAGSSGEGESASSPGPFVQGCHYAGCDQATKFSSKINRATPPPPPSPGRCTPRQGVFFFRAISGRGPAPCLFNTLFCFLLRSTFSHNPYPFFAPSSAPLLLSSSFSPWLFHL